jgi:hypothetical protein
VAEYEIVIEEEIPGRSPPSFVLKAVFAGGDRSEVICIVPLTCKYKIVGSVPGIGPLASIPPHVTSSNFSTRSDVPLTGPEIASKAERIWKR